MTDSSSASGVAKSRTLKNEAHVCESVWLSKGEGEKELMVVRVPWKCNWTDFCAEHWIQAAGSYALNQVEVGRESLPFASRVNTDEVLF